MKENQIFYKKRVFGQRLAAMALAMVLLVTGMPLTALAAGTANAAVLVKNVRGTYIEAEANATNAVETAAYVHLFTSSEPSEYIHVDALLSRLMEKDIVRVSGMDTKDVSAVLEKISNPYFAEPVRDNALKEIRPLQAGTVDVTLQIKLEPASTDVYRITVPLTLKKTVLTLQGKGVSQSGSNWELIQNAGRHIAYDYTVSNAPSSNITFVSRDKAGFATVMLKDGRVSVITANKYPEIGTTHKETFDIYSGERKLVQTLTIYAENPNYIMPTSLQAVVRPTSVYLTFRNVTGLKDKDPRYIYYRMSAVPSDNLGQAKEVKKISALYSVKGTESLWGDQLTGLYPNTTYKITVEPYMSNNYTQINPGGAIPASDQVLIGKGRTIEVRTLPGEYPVNIAFGKYIQGSGSTNVDKTQAVYINGRQEGETKYPAYDERTLRVGDTITYNIAVTDMDNKPAFDNSGGIVWHSSTGTAKLINSSRQSATESATFRIIKTGKTSITATTINSGLLARADLTVQAYETNLKLSRKQSVIYTNQTPKLMAEAKFSTVTSERTLEPWTVNAQDGITIYNNTKGSVSTEAYIVASKPGTYTLTAEAAAPAEAKASKAGTTFKVLQGIEDMQMTDSGNVVPGADFKVGIVLNPSEDTPAPATPKVLYSLLAPVEGVSLTGAGRLSVKRNVPIGTRFTVMAAAADHKDNVANTDGSGLHGRRVWKTYTVVSKESLPAFSTIGIYGDKSAAAGSLGSTAAQSQLAGKYLVVKDSFGRVIASETLRYTSSNQKILGITAEGKLIVKGAGSARLTAAATDGTKRSKSYTVKVTYDSLPAEQGKITLQLADFKTPDTRIDPVNGVVSLPLAQTNAVKLFLNVDGQPATTYSYKVHSSNTRVAKVVSSQLAEGSTVLQLTGIGETTLTLRDTTVKNAVPAATLTLQVTAGKRTAAPKILTGASQYVLYSAYSHADAQKIEMEVRQPAGISYTNVTINPNVAAYHRASPAQKAAYAELKQTANVSNTAGSADGICIIETISGMSKLVNGSYKLDLVFSDAAGNVSAVRTITVKVKTAPTLRMATSFKMNATDKNSRPLAIKLSSKNVSIEQLTLKNVYVNAMPNAFDRHFSIENSAGGDTLRMIRDTDDKTALKGIAQIKLKGFSRYYYVNLSIKKVR